MQEEFVSFASVERHSVCPNALMQVVLTMPHVGQRRLMLGGLLEIRGSPSLSSSRRRSHPCMTHSTIGVASVARRRFQNSLTTLGEGGIRVVACMSRTMIHQLLRVRVGLKANQRLDLEVAPIAQP